MSERLTGVVKWFNSQKGYGFIARDSGPDVFVHYSAIAGSGYRNLEEGEQVEFAITEGPKGPQASEVTRVGGNAGGGGGGYGSGGGYGGGSYDSGGSY